MAKELPHSEILTNLMYDETSPSGLRWSTDYSKRSSSGDVAGTLNKNKYWVVRLNDELFYVHRVIYFLQHGIFDKKLYIDHIDGNKSNNLAVNLRLVTASVNLRNKPANKTSGATGYKYISYEGSRHRFVVRWWADGKEKHKIFNKSMHLDALGEALKYRELLIKGGKLEMKDWYDTKDKR